MIADKFRFRCLSARYRLQQRRWIAYDAAAHHPIDPGQCFECRPWVGVEDRQIGQLPRFDAAKLATLFQRQRIVDGRRQ